MNAADDARRRRAGAEEGGGMNVIDRIATEEGRIGTYFLLWLLGVPASLLLILFMLGVGR